MRHDLLKRLRCPLTKEALILIDLDSGSSSTGAETRTGVLCNESWTYLYPVINGIPLMLVFRTPLSEGFVRDHEARLKSLRERHPGLATCNLPNQSPERGEKDVQKTFTEEWDSVKDSEFTFRYSEEQNATLQRHVWLRDMDDSEVAAVGSILDIGCGGFAAEARALSNLNPGVEVIGIDLNLSLVRNGGVIETYERVSAVVCSLFRLPFADDECFDLVFSQGVLHHTYSTENAIRAVESQVRRGGYLFIWLYAVEDPLRGKGLRKLRSFVSYLVLMRTLRPILSRSPVLVRKFFVYLIAFYNHFRFKYTKSRPPEWSFSNTIHGVYDMVTPRYAHDHSFNEMIEFVETLGFAVTTVSPLAYRKLMGWPVHGIGLLGRKDA